MRAVAAHHATDAVEALDAVDACIRVARAIDEPGWEANAIAIRIVTLIRTGEGGDSVADLVAAENALSRTRDLGLAGWAHTGLGYAYDLLRLYELCIPHFELAAEGDHDPLGLPEAPAINRLNLAESNLRWAHETRAAGRYVVRRGDPRAPAGGASVGGRGDRGDRPRRPARVLADRRADVAGGQQRRRAMPPRPR